MATLTVNLTDPESVSTALRALVALQPGCEVWQTGVAAERVANDAATPTPSHTRNPEPTDTTEPDPQTPDTNGMIWDAEIHSSPPRHNADGSWRARKGRKAEYDAAVEAARAGGIAEPEPQPATTEQESTGPSMPAAPAPTTPEPPVDYETMARRFMAMVTDGKIKDHNAVYRALGIDYTELETNQTMIDRLYAYMDALDNGETQDGAVRHAMGSE